MPDIAAEILRRTDAMLRARYSDRLAQFGENPRTLGWDNNQSQFVRFVLASECQPTGNKSVLDIGCGFADLLGYLSDEPSREPAQYTGVDINRQLLDVGAQHFPDATFIQANILLDNDIPEADVVFMLGVLNFRFQDFDNLDFAHAMISRAFGLARETLIVDLLSQCRDEAYPEEDFVYYYDPAQILRFALSLTPHVELRHDYPSIPQREMMLVMRHAPWTS